MRLKLYTLPVIILLAQLIQGDAFTTPESSTQFNWASCVFSPLCEERNDTKDRRDGVPGRRSTPPADTPTGTPSQLRLPCYCDGECGVYGDCCKDAATGGRSHRAAAVLHGRRTPREAETIQPRVQHATRGTRGDTRRDEEGVSSDEGGTKIHKDDISSDKDDKDDISSGRDDTMRDGYVDTINGVGGDTHKPHQDVVALRTEKQHRSNIHWQNLYEDASERESHQKFNIHQSSFNLEVSQTGGHHKGSRYHQGQQVKTYLNSYHSGRSDPNHTNFFDTRLSTHIRESRAWSNHNSGLAQVRASHTFVCNFLTPHPPQSAQRAVYMVNDCPPSASLQLTNKCRKTVHDEDYTYMMDIPVVSSTSNTIYSNIYCAKCHNDAQVSKFKHSILCDCNLQSRNYLLTMNYEIGHRMWTGDVPKGVECVPGIVQLVCFLNVEYPKDVGRHCEYNMVSKCSKGWRNTGVENMCKQYNYYVQDNENTIYKNIDCAKCNYVPLEKLSCLSTNLILRWGGSSTSHLFALSDLFSTNEDCAEEEIVDPIFGECAVFSHNNDREYAASIINIILISFSLLAMLLHIIIFILLFKKRNLHTKNLLSMTCALFWAELLLLICSHECNDEVGCYVSTIIVYYLFFCAFCWMNVMSYDICKTFRSSTIRSNSNRMYRRYAMYAFGCPAVMAIVSILVDQLAPHSSVSPGFGTSGFWFSNRGGLILFFIAPSELIFLANIIMLGVSMYDIYQQQQKSKFASASIVRMKSEKGKKKEKEQFIENKRIATDSTGPDESSTLNQIPVRIKEKIDKVTIDKARLILYTKLALIMGVPWFFALFDNVSVVCEYLFNILNSLQGLFIFIAFDCKKKVLVDVCERLGWLALAETMVSSTTRLSTFYISSSSAKHRPASSRETDGQEHKDKGDVEPVTNEV